MKISFTVNGRVEERDVRDDERLLDLIRDDLQLTGAKEGCGEGECGACTVLIDGKAVASCLVLAPQVDGKDVLTVEGLARGEELHPIQRAFVEKGAVQCGFCTPGFIMSTYALLSVNSDPSDEEILAALEGNLCRCTGYAKIIEAVRYAAELMRQEKN
ncbi:MAG TPA: (2Fe-2S)-binding protein [Candidatus Acetothermia bacterium]|nr:(2Fe-2S)-binding protein [Candidatus Acetothermia bacterium]HEX32174.1 (2Fe-2S)-binding protein [Candidatus Acetothermia bacterium]